MEFKRWPNPVTPKYRSDVAETLRVSKVVSSGLFDTTGTFAVVWLGDKTRWNNTLAMWALNLLNYTAEEDGVRTTRHGFLVVYQGRMTRNIGDKIRPVHTIDPGNIRFVNEWCSFRTKVTDSGWIFNERVLWSQQLSSVRLEEILADAEAGKRPPFFDDHTEFVKIEPGLSGRKVNIIRFSGVNDVVVVDTESRQLVGNYTQDLLSRERWEPKAVSSNPYHW